MGVCGLINTANQMLRFEKNWCFLILNENGEKKQYFITFFGTNTIPLRLNNFYTHAIQPDFEMRAD